MRRSIARRRRVPVTYEEGDAAWPAAQHVNDLKEIDSVVDRVYAPMDGSRSFRSILGARAWAWHQWERDDHRAALAYDRVEYDGANAHHVLHSLLDAAITLVWHAGGPPADRAAARAGQRVNHSSPDDLCRHLLRRTFPHVLAQVYTLTRVAGPA